MWIQSRENQVLNLKKSEFGFTLLEIIIALTILAFGFITVIQLFSGGAKLGIASDQYLKGVALAHHKMSELELSTIEFDSLGGEFENEEGYSWRLEVEPFDVPLNNEEENIQMAQLTLDVFWEDAGEEKFIQVTTLKTLGNAYPATDNLLRSTIKAQTGATAPVGTGTNTPTGPGAAPPIDAVQPDPDDVQFDISGFPLSSDGDNQGQIGVAK